MHCVACGHANPERAKFCGACGAKVVGDEFSEPEPLDASLARLEGLRVTPSGATERRPGDGPARGRAGPCLPSWPVDLRKEYR